MLYRKFALAAGVLALALVPSAVRAEYMTVTFAMTYVSGPTDFGTVSGTITNTGITSYPSSVSVSSNGTQTYGSWQTSLSDASIQFTSTGGGVPTISMNSNGFLYLGASGDPSLTIDFSGTQGNIPGTSNKAFIDLQSVEIQNTTGDTINLTITATGNDYTAPTGNAIFSQTDSAYVTPGSGSIGSASATSTLTPSVGSAISISTNPAFDGSNGTSQTDSTYVSLGSSNTYSLQSVMTVTGITSDTSLILIQDPMVTAPEPSTFVLAFLGLSSLGVQRLMSRRKKQTAR